MSIEGISHISQESSEYQEYQEKNRTEEDAFAHFTIRELEDMRNKDPRWRKSDEEINAIRAERLEYPKKMISVLWNEDGLFRSRVKDFLNQSLADDAAKKVLEREFQKDGLELEDVYAAISSGDISDDAMEAMLWARKRAFDARQEKLLTEELPPIMDDFKNSLSGWRDSGKLPLSEEELDDRMKNLKVTVKDPFYMSHESASHDSGTLEIGMDASVEELKHLIFHESMHAISGATVARITEDGRERMVEQRRGFRFKTRYKKGMGSGPAEQRFGWLNEGMTEYLTMQLLEGDWHGGKSEIAAYWDERNEVHRIIEAGVPEQYLTDAYFEDYDETAVQGQRVEAWKRLTDAIDERLGEGRLMELEDKWQRQYGFRQ